MDIRLNEARQSVGATHIALSEKRQPVGATNIALNEKRQTVGATNIALNEKRQPVGAMDIPLRKEMKPVRAADIPLSEETLRMAREAKLDQGIHETEVSFNGEADLKTALIMCEKNPTHDQFYPINEVTLDKFPEAVQEPFVLDFIKLKGKETVRLSCNYTSEQRPEGYPFNKYRGSAIARYGSGRVWGVFKEKIQSDIPCPFSDCVKARGPHYVSGYLRVHTAMHVVFDDEEAQRTTVEFFYDTPGDLSTIVTARGYKVVQSDLPGDYCVMDCVTHDPDLCTTLDTIRQQWSQSWPEVDKILYGHKLSVVVSHPHGCSKQISIGLCLDREWDRVTDDQGIHETEVSFNGEADLQTALIMCQKNPTHANFYPINEVTLDKFPEAVQEPFVLDFIKLKGKETVRLSCNYTSEQRPEGYPFHNYRGSAIVRYGSGRVWGVFKEKIQSDIPCPLSDCVKARGPHSVSGYLRVHTAMHVVFDDEEAQRTTVEFFYDTPGDLSTIVTARGYKVVQSDLPGDYCVMDCVTHDPDLCTTLDTIRQQWSQSWPEVDKILYGHKVSVVVSHPHGCSKQISIGSCLHREWQRVSDDQCWYRFTYETATCPGCSGAPVWVSGWDGLASGYAPHSGHEGSGVNRSAVWFFWKPQLKE